MDNLQRFIDEINGFVTDEGGIKQSIDSLRYGEPHMTEAELVELNEALGQSEDLFMNDLLVVYDCGDLDKDPPAIVCAAYEWLVGPFEVSHRDYDPYWFRKKNQ